MTDRILEFKDLTQKGCLNIQGVMEGLLDYPHSLLFGTKEQLGEYLRLCLQLNGPEYSFVDFYYGKLNKVEQQKANSVLRQDQIAYIQSMNIRENEIYFQANEDLLEIANELSVSEMLFTTFFFGKISCTIWGNYGNRYPIFFRDWATKEFYDKYAGEKGLDIDLT